MIQVTSRERRLKDLKFMVAAKILDEISGLYSRYEKAIAELVVNGYDADANSVVIDTGRERIVISDNGSGMDEQDIREVYMFLASGQKRVVRRTPIYHRLPIGSKGIGKLAGLGIARRMEVRTTKNARGYSFAVDLDELKGGRGIGKLNEAILDRSPMEFFEFTPGKNDSPGTVVTLSRLRMGGGPVDPKRVMAYIARDIPLGPTFRVTVNGQACKPTSIDAKRRVPVVETLPNLGEIRGEILIAKKRLPNPGVSTSVRNRVVGDPKFFGIKTSSLRYNVGDLITGLIEVPGFDPEEGGEGELAVITADRERFVETHPKYIVYAEYMTTVLSKICRDLEKEYDDRREAEKRAKVDDAIKQVGEDLSAFDKLRNPPVGAGAQVTGARSENGDLYSRPTVSVVGREPQGRSGPKRRIPPDTWESIQATLESGRLRFGNVPYVIKQQNLGEEFEECEVRREQHLILVNTDHPSYEMAVREKCVEIVVFRAVAGKLAAEESRSAAEMCERLDEMVRFHASRVKTRIERAEAVD